MFSTIKNTILFFFLIFFLTSSLYAQYVPSKERGDAKYRRKATMEGNQIRTTVFNYGMTGREGAVPITEQVPYEWPKNTGQVYLAVAGIMVGAEVVDDQGQVQHIISRCHYLESPDGRSWNFEPVPGYFNQNNPDGFATSNDPTTWPDFWPDKQNDENDPGWPGKWNGYFGKDVFNADQEMYFHAADNNYDRYSYYFPDTTDLTRKGLGLILDVRVMAWSQILVQDALYLLFKVKNDGTKPLNKVGVTILWADFVGGEGPGNISEFDLANDIAWSRNEDNLSPDPAFGSKPVGIVGGAFLETPGNAVDRIDNDGDSPEAGPKVTADMLVGESDDNIPRNDARRTDGIDNNGNGLIDENKTDIAFGSQEGVTYADGIGQSIDPAWLVEHPRFYREENSPLVTQEMVNASAGDKWKRWPPDPENDTLQNGKVHLIMVESDDIGFPYKDNIDNDGNGEDGSPTITQDMIDMAAKDPYKRYKVNDKIILYNVTQETLGMKYADGIDNDNNGAIDENIDEGIDVMIDESRSDGIDNDYDWNPATDDVGLDGVPDTHDPGEGDGKPTSGARFGLPGEPNIDVTDVSETDQIGITGTFYKTSQLWIGSGGFTDEQIWSDFMVPGNYFDSSDVQSGDYNLFISSGLFPLKPGQTEPISLAIIFANGPVQDPNGKLRKAAVLKKRIYAQQTYNNDYRFANAPYTPKLTAIPGDKKVTLYWDDAAEKSFDSYIANIGGNGHDFEGYRIYRASDPAFLDSKVITNGQGSPTYLLPVAQFDLKDGIKGYDSLAFEGVHFYMGDDTGLKHSWVDTDVKDGFTYYYAITSYDVGFASKGITPSECSITLSLKADGTVKSLGKNVAQVTPEAPSGGYVSPTLGTVDLIQGYTTSKVTYNVIDPTAINDGHVYYITFEDTIKKGSADTLTTKNFTLRDSTQNVTLIDKSTQWGPGVEEPITDGFQLTLINESKVEVDTSRSGWNNPGITPFILQKFTSPRPSEPQGQQKPNDYKIIFGDAGFGTSTSFVFSNGTYASQPVNFKVYNVSEGKFIDFAFLEFDHSGPQANGWFSSNGGASADRIVFLEDNGQTLSPTWWFYLARLDSAHPTLVLPQAGDTANLFLKKPFLSSDVFRFVAKAGSIDNTQAKDDLSNIKVVPNPYLANALWEPKNPYSSGRGPRSIHFTHLPNKCTIRIFTVDGELVKQIEHDSNLIDGTAEWNLLTKDNLSASYGIYIYQIDAPGIGTKVGKFAIIK